jgi:two-component system, OmpR family, osmolarity sensor histidine kinase EnvZ
MVVDWLKRSLPRSLYGRAALILVVPVVSLQIVVSAAFVQRIYEDATRQMTRALVPELLYLREIADAAPDPATAAEDLARIGPLLALTVELPGPEAPQADIRRLADLSGRAMIETLRAQIPDMGPVDLSGQREVLLWIPSRWGDMGVSFNRRLVSVANPHQLIVLTLVFGALLTLVSYIFLRNQLRPIRRLAEAATDFGKGRVVHYRPSGANEVRVAGAAFLDMRNRIERQTQARTFMLSGISHDLRTPLTRLRLGLALIDDPEVPALLRDVDEMGRMLDSFLDHARGEAADETQPVDVMALLEGIIADARRAGQAAFLHPPEGSDVAPVPLRPVALRRAVDNLIGNALRHGTRADISVLFGDRTIRIRVEDDGPGIAPESRDEAVRPFTRLDPARNQNRGAGVGLGLAIVADAARVHGGSLRLGESARLGGLQADLVLPR